jgi:hypothetical protein
MNLFCRRNVGLECPSLSTLLIGFIGGFVAWIVTTIVGEPVRRFFQLRTQAALILAKYDDRPWIDNPEAKPPEAEWLEKRREAFDEIGSELVAFANSNSFIARLLHHKLLGKYRYNIRHAGDNLRMLAEVYPGTQVWHETHRQIQRALKITGWPN